MSNHQKIYVYFAHNTETPEPLGTITVQQVRGKEMFSFEFNNDWLKNHPGRILDPDLQLYTGPQFTSKNNFGIFTDSAPDRWGRRLMLRREKIRAAKEERRQKILQESDFLLGVYDETRMGDLRFKIDPQGKFMNDCPYCRKPSAERHF